jgi:hypothetical protein
MSAFRNKFAVIAPGLSGLTRRAAPAVDADALIKAPATALMDGEFVQYDGSGNFKRADTLTGVAYHVISDYGDSGLQASRKIDAIVVGSYVCNTLIFDPTGLALNAPLMLSLAVDISDGYGAIRAGVILHDAVVTKIIVGFVTKLPANNGGLLEFHRVGL